MDNGNLIFPPFQASDYKQDVHAQTYRCIARNELGKIQSRDVHVRAVAHQEYRVVVHEESAIAGNDVQFKCNIQSYVADFVQVVAWVDSEGSSFMLDQKYDGK